MHEMSILGNVMDVVLRYAQENDAREIRSVTLVVGELHDVVDDLMESCFQFLARDTIAAHAQLNMVKVPLKVQCQDCLLVFPAKVTSGNALACPDCGCSHVTIRTGKEFYIRDIEVV